MEGKLKLCSKKFVKPRLSKINLFSETHFSCFNPCLSGDGLRLALDSDGGGDFIPCPDLDEGIGGPPPTLEDCEYLQLMGYDVECVVEEDQIIKDPSFIGTTADCIYEKLKSVDGFKNLASAFDGLGTEFDVELKIGPTQDPTANGQAWFRGPNQPIEITFNEAKMGRSALQVARTIVHEMVHAEMYRALNTSTPTVEEMDFVDTFNAYVLMYRGEDDQHHNAMADNWVEKMASILSTVHQQLDPSGFNQFKNIYYPTGIPDHFYESVAWEGLEGTLAWDLMQGITAPSLLPAPKDVIAQDLDNADAGRKICVEN